MSDEQAPDLKDVEGVVKWFDPRKGYGFIVGPEGQDVFVHFTSIQGEGFRVLKDGSEVTYDAVRGDKGWHAMRVVCKELEVNVRKRSTYARTPRR